jgi:hypothetical protein
MTIRPVGAELLHVGRKSDRRTIMTTLILAFRTFAKKRKNLNFCFSLFENSVLTSALVGSVFTAYFLKNSKVI